MDFKYPEANNVYAWLMIGLFSAWGGVVRYIIDYKNGGEGLTLSGLRNQFIISGFTGVLGGLIGFEGGASYYMTLILSGTSGAMGSFALNVIWKFYIMRKR